MTLFGRSVALGVGVALAFGAATTDVLTGDAGDPVAAGQVARAILSTPGDAAYGEYLAGECMTCHQKTGATQGVPPIAGLPTDYLVQALVEYRIGLRPHDVMRLMTARLSNEQIAALAAYFSGLRPEPAG